MQDGIRNNVLKKILEFIQSLPEAEGLEGEPAEHEVGETPTAEGGEHPKGSIEIMAMGVKPKMDDADKMKGC